MEVGLEPDDLQEVTKENVPDYTYASLGNKKTGDDVPPEIPKQTPEAIEVMNVPSPLYETADLSG